MKASEFLKFIAGKGSVITSYSFASNKFRAPTTIKVSWISKDGLDGSAEFNCAGMDREERLKCYWIMHKQPKQWTA